MPEKGDYYVFFVKFTELTVLAEISVDRLKYELFTRLSPFIADFVCKEE